MSEEKIQKKVPEALREKTQYALAFGVIATMLFAVGFPPFIIVFFAIFAFFLWKTFAAPSPSGTREIFEFYLSANDILRDDERRWFGFEIQNVIGRGERIVQLMNGAPPLVYFTLGALYNRAGNHQAAIQHLAYIVENENSDEKKYAYATPELKKYVDILRKIEREPAEHPLTAAAVRALERTRRNRSRSLLEESRAALKEIEILKNKQIADAKNGLLNENGAAGETVAVFAANSSNGEKSAPHFVEQKPNRRNSSNGENINGEKSKSKDNGEFFKPPRPISEVLHDIYDK